jgi:hydroxypyruvate isomerase
MEPINTRDIPRFFLTRQDHAHEIVGLVGAPNLKVQMDLYHCQIVEGDVAMKIRKYLPTGNVGHFQIAGVPARHEPDVGELHYPYLFNVIDEVSGQCSWDGWIGCEYRPKRGGQPGGTSAGLGWLKTLP